MRHRPAGRAPALLLSAWALVACDQTAPAAAPTPQPAAADDAATPPANVYAGHFTAARPLEEVRELLAVAETVAPPSATRLLAAPFAGRVQRVDVAPGDEVKAGQVIAVLLLPDLGEAATDYVIAQRTSQSRQKRLQQLVALSQSGMARASAVTDAEVAAADAEGRSLAAAARLRGAGIDPASAQKWAEAGGRYWLTAPHEGVVVEVMGHPGSALQQNDPVARLETAAPVRVEAHIAPALWAADFAGFELMLDDAVVPITPLAAARTLSPKSGTARVWFSVDEAGIAAGRTGLVRPKGKDPLFVVPADAVTRTDEGATVAIRDQGTLVSRPVTVHAEVAGLVVVSGPVAAQEVGVRD